MINKNTHRLSTESVCYRLAVVAAVYFDMFDSLVPFNGVVALPTFVYVINLFIESPCIFMD